MFKSKSSVVIKFVMAWIICVSLLGGWVKTVNAVTCTWQGGFNPNWDNNPNWTCGHIPNSTDDVLIPSTIYNNPVIHSGVTAVADSITIQSGGLLTANDNGDINAVSLTINSGGQLTTADQSGVSITLTGSLINNGTFLSRGQTYIVAGNFNNNASLTNSGNYTAYTPSIAISSPFNNSGTVDIQDGYINLFYGGTHSGTFTGSSTNTGIWAGLWLGNSMPKSESFTFTSDSTISLPRLVAGYGYTSSPTVDINGTYSPSGDSQLVLSQASIVTIDPPTDGTILLADRVSVGSSSKLVLEPHTGWYEIPWLFMYENSEVTNNAALIITSIFSWEGGTLSGSGNTEVGPSVTDFSIYAFPHTINGHTLTNLTTANWNYGNITLSNGAGFENDSTFNANASTTMSSGGTESFTNDGVLNKKTAGTTTTINVPFTNTGTVKVIAGILSFPQGIDNGEDAIIDLGGGTFNPGETLTLDLGDNLIGSGTLDADLINGGEVSPGESPGIININGDYTQNTTGILEIELGGTTAGSGYDQLAVTGATNLGGTLNVSLWNEFSPELGQIYTILTCGSLTNEFITVTLPDLPGGLTLEIDYGDIDITLTVVEGSSLIFLPLILN